MRACTSYFVSYLQEEIWITIVPLTLAKFQRCLIGSAKSMKIGKSFVNLVSACVKKCNAFVLCQCQLVVSWKYFTFVNTRMVAFKFEFCVILLRCDPKFHPSEMVENKCQFESLTNLLKYNIQNIIISKINIEQSRIAEVIVTG